MTDAKWKVNTWKPTFELICRTQIRYQIVLKWVWTFWILKKWKQVCSMLKQCNRCFCQQPWYGALPRKPAKRNLLPYMFLINFLRIFFCEIATFRKNKTYWFRLHKDTNGSIIALNSVSDSLIKLLVHVCYDSS